jgi:hypothetical protein
MQRRRWIEKETQPTKLNEQTPIKVVQEETVKLVVKP